jgi:hypothetical protein
MGNEKPAGSALTLSLIERWLAAERLHEVKSRGVLVATPNDEEFARMKEDLARRLRQMKGVYNEQ